MMKTINGGIRSLLPFFLFVLFASGCNSIAAVTEQKILKDSGINDSSSYQIYEAAVLADSSRPEGSVLVSLAANSDFSIRYKYKGEEVITGYCYAMPGDSIEYTIESTNNSNPKFDFKHILLCCSNKVMKEPDYIECEDTGVITIPEDKKYQNISLLPIGEYGTKELILEDFYNDKFGEKNTLDGTWIINGDEIKDDRKQVDSTRSYSVEYEYDNNKYYFINAFPSPIAYSDYNGHVVFEIARPNESNVTYSVLLGSYYDVSIEVKNAKSIDGSITRSDKKTPQDLKKEMSLPKLRDGNTITIRTNEPYEIFIDKVLQKPVYTGVSNFSYTYSYVVGNNNSFTFDPSKYSFPHGTVNFYINDTLINEPINLTNEALIKYESATVENGYYLPSGSITVDGANTDTLIKSIKFYSNKKVTVQLLPKVSGGNLEYYVNGNRIYKDTVSLLSGQTIKIHLNEWKGWNPSVNTHELSYTVTENQNQTITFTDQSGNKISSNDLFIEANNHKPTLTVSFGPSLKGTEIQFDISAASLKDYKNGEFSNITGLALDTYIDKKKIGSNLPISISLHSSKYALLDKAVKLEIKKHSDKGDTLEVRYVTKFPWNEKIDIYPENQIANPSSNISKIEIVASLCPIEQYKTASLKNASIIIKPSKEIRTTPFSPDDYIDPERKVDIRVEPANGYCVSGEPSGVYQKAGIAYKDVKKELNKIKLQQQYTITLNSKDEYGTCTYKRANGDVISGKIKVNDTELITLEYTLTNKGKHIDLGWGKRASSIQKTLSITSKYNEKTVSRSDFNIKVKGG